MLQLEGADVLYTHNLKTEKQKCLSLLIWNDFFPLTENRSDFFFFPQRFVIFLHPFSSTLKEYLPEIIKERCGSTETKTTSPEN